MGRTLFVEERLQSFIDKLYIADSWTVGLIIGQLTLGQKDHAVHLITTPLQDEGPAEDSSAQQGKKKVKKPTATLETLDDFLITTHAKQSLRMLPGGLKIIGVFACAAPDMMQKSQMKLKQLLFSIQKEVQKSQVLWKSLEEVTERYVLQICPATRKLTCRTFDVSDNKCGARPAELKFQSSLDRWQQLNTSFSVDFPFPIPVADTSTALPKQIQHGLQPLCTSLQNAVAIIDGRLTSETDPLDTSSHQQTHAGGKKGKKQKAAATAAADQADFTHSVQLFVEMHSNNNTGEPQATECGAKMLLRGSIQGRAYVNGRATIKEATQAIKEDVIHSLVSRCELLCEDLLQTEEEQDPKVLYEMPVRVFAPLPGSHVCLCDYMFQDETAADSMDRFKELVGLSIEEEQLDSQCERIPTEEELGKPKCRSRHSSETQVQARSTKSMAAQYLGAAIGGLVAAVAAGISFIYLGQE